MESDSKFVNILLKASRFIVMIDNVLSNLCAANLGFIVNNEVFGRMMGDILRQQQRVACYFGLLAV